MIGWELPPHNSGGLGKACYNLAKSLSDKGLDITFVLPKKVEVEADFMTVKFVNISKIKHQTIDPYTTLRSYIKHKDRLVNFNPFDYVSAAIAYGLEMHRFIEELQEQGDYDIIHAHDWLTVPAALEARRFLGVPLVLHIHATEYDRTGGHDPNPYVFEMEKDGIEKADKVVSVSNFTKQILIDHYQADGGKIEVVHNGTESLGKKHLAPALTEIKKLGYKIVLYLGRITLMKGPEYFVHAARRALDFDQKIVFVVTGSGDMQESMMNEAARCGIMNSMIFTGFLRGEEKDRIYQSADLYILPSVSEPFGLTVLEAIANGTPAIISKQSGVSEVIQNALKVDFWDTDDIANKILAAVSYPSLRKDLIVESTKELRNVTWDHSADKCIGIYSRLI